MAAKKKLINLLPQEEFEGSTTGRILRWAMTTFRYIVIVTEMVVMAAFLSRFYFDAKNSDLNDALRIREAEVLANSELEQNFRNIQNRLRIFQELTKGPKSSETVTKIVSKTPSGIKLQSISFQNSSALVKGSSGSEVGIVQFISNLKSQEVFKSVSLEQVNSSEEDPSLIVFNIKVNTK